MGGPVRPGGVTFPGSGQRRAHVRGDSRAPIARALPWGSAETRELRGLLSAVITLREMLPSLARSWCHLVSRVRAACARALGRAEALMNGRLVQVAGQSASVQSREEKVGTRLLKLPLVRTRIPRPRGRSALPAA